MPPSPSRAHHPCGSHEPLQCGLVSLGSCLFRALRLHPFSFFCRVQSLVLTLSKPPTPRTMACRTFALPSAPRERGTTSSETCKGRVVHLNPPIPPYLTRRRRRNLHATPVPLPISRLPANVMERELCRVQSIPCHASPSPGLRPSPRIPAQAGTEHSPSGLVSVCLDTLHTQMCL